MDEDDRDAALAHQLELEHQWFDESQRLLWEDAEAYNAWLDQLAHQEFEERTHA